MSGRMQRHGAAKLDAESRGLERFSGKNNLQLQESLHCQGNLWVGRDRKLRSHTDSWLRFLHHQRKQKASECFNGTTLLVQNFLVLNTNWTNLSARGRLMTMCYYYRWLEWCVNGDRYQTRWNIVHRRNYRKSFSFYSPICSSYWRVSCVLFPFNNKSMTIRGWWATTRLPVALWSKIRHISKTVLVALFVDQICRFVSGKNACRAYRFIRIQVWSWYIFLDHYRTGPSDFYFYQVRHSNL